MAAAAEASPGVIDSNAASDSVSTGSGSGSGAGAGQGSGLGEGYRRRHGRRRVSHRQRRRVAAPAAQRPAQLHLGGDARQGAGRRPPRRDRAPRRHASATCASLRSLDSVFGLDEEAIKAAKQFRFVTGDALRPAGRGDRELRDRVHAALGVHSCERSSAKTSAAVVALVCVLVWTGAVGYLWLNEPRFVFRSEFSRRPGRVIDPAFSSLQLRTADGVRLDAVALSAARVRPLARLGHLLPGQCRFAPPATCAGATAYAARARL